MTRRQGIPVLMYHFIGEGASGEADPYTIPAREFRSHLRLLRYLGYKSVGLGDLLSMRSNLRGGPRWPVVISFDDGHASFHEAAAPALADYGFSAINFLVSDWIGKKGYMGWREIRELASAGFEFGSHSVSHPVLPSLTGEEEEREVSQSKDVLQDGLGREVDFFAYRGGHYAERTKEAVRRAGYTAAVSSDRGLNTSETDRYALRRMPIRRGDATRQLIMKLSGNRARGRLDALVGHALGKW